MKAMGSNGMRADVAEAIGEAVAQRAAEPTVLLQLEAAADPGGVAVALGAQGEKVLGRPGAGVQPAEPSLARKEVDHLHGVAAKQLDPAARPRSARGRP